MRASKAEDADGLTPFKDDNAASCKIDRKYVVVLGCGDYTGTLILPGA